MAAARRRAGGCRAARCGARHADDIRHASTRGHVEKRRHRRDFGVAAGSDLRPGHRGHGRPGRAGTRRWSGEPARPPATNAAPFPHAAAAKEPRLPAARPKGPPAARANVAAPAPSAASAMVYVVYEVLVGAGGVAESIVVAQSSGTPRFDEAGGRLIPGPPTLHAPAAPPRA